ncbi:MAG: N(6)-L-threonylcarbamoyladenine synthase [Sporanaerobacter sp.]|jgi:N6-L-threonylcarbamoyladenine synthase
MMNNYYLGIDTSAYTTSVAVVDENNDIVFDLRKILEVEKNKKGLRQQEAVFKHIKNLPLILDELAKSVETRKIVSVSTSGKPRNIEGSYMPVFTVGKGQAYIISRILGVPFKEFSHQEGHIGAGMMNSPLEKKDNFLAFHISGGTTELLLVDNNKDNLNIDIVGGTLDISIGQLIDRIGVKLGLTFPCGSKMDNISQNGDIVDERLALKIEDTWANFSGYENFFNRLIDIGRYEKKDIVKTLFNTIYLSLEKIILYGCRKHDINDVLLVGGVASNLFIRENLKNDLHTQGINIYVPERSFCSDNAIGVSYLSKIKTGHMWGF